MAAAEETKEEKSEEIITAVYKVSLHCKQCIREIRQPLMRAQGVRKVDCDIESGMIKVNGTIDVVKMHKRIEKLSKKKVELVSPKPKIVPPEVTEKKIVKETIKETVVRKTTVKVHMHCEKCEQDLRRMLLRHKGIYTVKTDFKAQILIVEGSIESERLVSYIRNKIRKHAEIVSASPKEEKKLAEVKEEKEIKASTAVAAADVAVNTTTTTTTTAKTVTKSEKVVEMVEFKDEEKVGVKDEKGNIPYFVHYVYAPQIFSDENPHACSIM